MKKFLALLLAMMLVLVNVAALASGDVDPAVEPETPTEEGGETGATGDNLTPYIEEADVSIDAAATTYTIPKVINVRDAENYKNGQTPAQTIKFTQKGDVTTTAEIGDTAKSALAVSFTDAVYAAGETTKDLTLTLPTYPAPGVYEYEIEETPVSNFEGMTYGEILKLKVTVITDTDEKSKTFGQLIVGGIAIRQNDTKVDEIENEYAAGDLKVTKTVTGNLGDKEKKFPITISFESTRDVGSIVTYTGPDGNGTITFTNKKAELKVNLADSESVTIKNLPEGVTYTVIEDNTIEHLTDPKAKPDNPNAYEVKDQIDTATAIEAAKETSKTITNNKEMDIDTGIVLDTLPYVLLMMLAMVGFMMTARKREEY
jgi:hypothetical protein